MQISHLDHLVLTVADLDVTGISTAACSACRR